MRFIILNKKLQMFNTIGKILLLQLLVYASIDAMVLQLSQDYFVYGYVRALLKSSLPDDQKKELISKSFDRGTLSILRDSNAETLLLKMVKEADSKGVRILVELGVDVNEGAASLLRPLHVAATKGLVEIVDLLLSAGALVDALYFPDPVATSGMTPLHIAAYYGHLAIVKLLLNKGANPDIKYKGRAPLNIAFAKGTAASVLIGKPYSDIVQVLTAYSTARLVEYRAKQTITLLSAARGGEVEEIERCAEEWNIKENGPGALCLAARAGHARVVDLLLRRGAYPAIPYGQEAPLLLACQNGHGETVSLLLNYGVDPEESYNGETPLFKAVQIGSIEIVRLLLQANASTSSCNGVTPESIARKNGFYEILKLLEQYRVDRIARLLLVDAPHFDELKPLVTPDIVNKPCNDGRTLLVLASERGRADAVEFLLKAGASVHTPCIPPCTDTPLVVAARHGHDSVVELLLEAGAGYCISAPLSATAAGWNPRTVRLILMAQSSKLEEVMKKQISVLFMAARSGDEKLLDLVAAEWNVNAYENGHTALFVASLRGHVSLVATLLARGADPELLSSSGVTPLFAACDFNHVGVVEWLLKYKAVQRDCNGVSPLYAASEKGHLQVVKSLLAADACSEDTLRSAFYAAAKAGHASIVRFLLCNGVRADDIDPKSIVIGNREILRLIAFHVAKKDSSEITSLELTEESEGRGRTDSQAGLRAQNGKRMRKPWEGQK